MKFKDFLSENYKTEIDLDEIKEKIIKEYGKLPKLDAVLYRGMTGNSNYYILDSNSRVRKSSDTSNHYTVIFDNQLKELGQPLRSRSLICTTDESVASGFDSNVFVIIPVNKNSKVGIVNNQDIWGLLIHNKDGITHSINRLNNEYDKLKIKDTSFESIVKGIYDNIQPPLDNEEKQFLSKVFDRNKDIETQVKEKYDLNKLGVTFGTFSDAIKNDNTEVWISDKCYAIKLKEYKKLLEE